MRCSIQHPDKIKLKSDYANVITIQNKPCYKSWHEPERLKPLVEMFSLSQSLSPVHHSKRAHWNQFKFAAHSWSPPSSYVMFNSIHGATGYNLSVLLCLNKASFLCAHLKLCILGYSQRCLSRLLSVFKGSSRWCWLCNVCTINFLSLYHRWNMMRKHQFDR